MVQMQVLSKEAVIATIATGIGILVIHQILQRQKRAKVVFVSKPSESAFMDWVRSRWTVGSRCEIYCETARQWLEGDVSWIRRDAAGEWLEVLFLETKSKQRRTLRVLRGDRERIRPFSGTLDLWRQRFRSKDSARSTPFGLCQSPINLLADSAPNRSSGPPVAIEYPKEVTSASIENTGSTVQINVPSDSGCRLTIGGEAYFLRQFHFHTPSEHRVDAAQFAMEMHLVHSNEAGHIAVLGFIFTATPKGSMPKAKGDVFLKQFWDRLPAPKTKEAAALGVSLRFGPLFETVDGSKMEWFEYGGSLTTPPFTEGVQWMVSRSLSSITELEVAQLSGCWGGTQNARDCHDYYGRSVAVRSDICCAG